MPRILINFEYFNIKHLTNSSKSNSEQETFNAKGNLFGVTLLIRQKPYLFGITSLICSNLTYSEISRFIGKNYLCSVETIDFKLETKVYSHNVTNYIGVLLL